VEDEKHGEKNAENAEKHAENGAEERAKNVEAVGSLYRMARLILI
jgi:hypothetical protein